MAVLVVVSKAAASIQSYWLTFFEPLTVTEGIFQSVEICRDVWQNIFQSVEIHQDVWRNIFQSVEICQDVWQNICQEVWQMF